MAELRMAPESQLRSRARWSSASVELFVSSRERKRNSMKRGAGFSEVMTAL
jgi:hypothetical protein